MKKIYSLLLISFTLLAHNEEDPFNAFIHLDSLNSELLINIGIKDNKFHQVKLFMKDGVFELRSVEYNQPIPGYRFKKDPIEIETYEAVFLDSKGKQLYQVNIGNPLLVKAQHIGFEDSEFFYGYDNQASFYIPFPKNIEPDKVVIYKNLLNTKEKLQTILIN